MNLLVLTALMLCSDSLDPRVELLWVRLPRLVELERDLGVHTEGEVVVDYVEGRVVHTCRGDRQYQCESFKRTFTITVNEGPY